MSTTTSGWNSVLNAFSAAHSGISSHVGGISSALYSMSGAFSSSMGSIISSVNRAAAAVNSAASSIASAVSRAASAAASMPTGVPRAMGVERVPYDNYPIMAHEGERLLTKNEANQYERSTRGVRMVSRAMGTGEIREDNTPILAHEGEKLLTKQEAKQSSGNMPPIIINNYGDINDKMDVDDIMDEMLRKLKKAVENMP